jgi:hypothetical protein
MWVSELINLHEQQLELAERAVLAEAIMQSYPLISTAMVQQMPGTPSP